MFKINLNQRFLYIISALLLVSSCVGTIENKNPVTTKGTTTTTSPLYFDGIVGANPVADDKVEVLFYPSSGLASEVTYLVNYDGASQPIAIPGSVLNVDYRGLLKATVSSLGMNTSYSFNVQVKDVHGNQSTNDKTYTAKTFANITANFNGIGDVDNLSGSDGRNALLVKWPQAERQGTEIVPREMDPVQYEIVLVNSNFATPEAFDDTSFVEPIRKVVYVASDKISSQVNGLMAGTKYYIRVRAIHYGTVLYASDPDYKLEQNSRYFEAETLGDQISAIEVDLNNFTVENAPGIAGLTTFNLSWESAQGAFNHYRIYYHKAGAAVDWNFYKPGKNNVCTAEAGYECKQVDFSVSETTISGLEPYSDYYIYLVICGDTDCTSTQMLEYFSNNPYKTDPGAALFGGITEIETAKYHWAVDEFYLKYLPPDLSTGAMDGLLVELKARAEGPFADTILNHPIIANPTDYSVPVFDFLTDSFATVRGIDPYSAEQYCFSLIPYTVELGVVVEHRTGEVVKCTFASMDPPTALEFRGVDSTVFNAFTNSLTVVWQAPSGGIYNKFVVFVRSGTAFNFAEAVINDPNYARYEVDYGENQFTIPFLPAGVYSIGVVAYFEMTDEYSEFNSNIAAQVVSP